MKYCITCGACDDATSKCRLTGRPVNPTADFCSQHLNKLYSCDRCGCDMLPAQAIIMEDGKLLCPTCYSALDTCQSCEQAGTCAFQSDPSPIPPYVMKTVKQGNMIAQTQVQNPERIKATCEAKCKCYDPNEGCMREYGYCTSYKESP